MTPGTSTKGLGINLGSDGAMLKGLQTINGKWYYLDQDGRMATDPVTLTPDQDGALQYPRPCKIENHTSDHRLYLAKFQHLIYDENIGKNSAKI